MKNYPLYSADRYRDFAELIEGLGKKYAKNRALVWYTRSREEKSVTFGQMAKDVEALKEAFIRKGLAGKHLAIVGENSYQWLLAYMAATGCGSVAVCIDIEQSDETIMQMLRAADAAAAFAAPPYLEICRKALEGKGEVLRLHGKGTETSLSDWVQEGAEQIASGGKSPAPLIEPGQTASIVFTSGTTSTSKPVMLSHRAILTNASDAWNYVLVGEKVFTNLPLYHTYGLTCAVVSVWMRGSTPRGGRPQHADGAPDAGGHPQPDLAGGRAGGKGRRAEKAFKASEGQEKAGDPEAGEGPGGRPG